MELRETTPLISTTSLSQRYASNVHVCFDKIWTGCLVLVLITGFVTGMYLLSQEGEDELIKESFYFVPKHFWNAEPLNGTFSALKLPADRILFSQTNTSDCTMNWECINLLQVLQKRHKEDLSQPDILYNFVVGGDGRIYEGRGWQNATDWQHSNNKLLLIALAGSFEDHPPTSSQMEALRAFTNYSVTKNRIVPCFHVIVDHVQKRYLLDAVFQLQEYMRDQNRC